MTEILYKKPCSKFAKAYIPKISIKENVRFHKNRKTVVTVDIKDFFPSIKNGYVLNVFLSFGYNLPVAMILTCLCCYNGCLPQGAPTSAYLSNLVMNRFDYNVSKYCISKDIRYTRYADDMTFSGDFDIAALLHLVDNELKTFSMYRNPKKLNVMPDYTSQKVTGVVVNEKIQVTKEYRMKIRQEIHYIQKFGLNNHLEHIGENRTNYLSHLKGKIEYALFINPKDEKMHEYLEFLKSIKT